MSAFHPFLPLASGPASECGHVSLIHNCRVYPPDRERGEDEYEAEDLELEIAPISQMAIIIDDELKPKLGAFLSLGKSESLTWTRPSRRRSS
jgi:hypothetical protein